MIISEYTSRHSQRTGFISVELIKTEAGYQVKITDTEHLTGVEEYTKEAYALEAYLWWAEHIR